MAKTPLRSRVAGKRRASFFAIFLAATLVGSAGCQDAPPKKRPNVLWITIDALRADHLGCYGYSKPTSPFLDRFAASAVRFDQAISQAPSTKASVASFFTSLYPAVHRTVWHEGAKGHKADRLPERAVTLAERFQRAGYVTAGFVANPHLQEQFGFRQGFGFYHYRSWQKAPSILALTAQWIRQLARCDRPRFCYVHLMDVHYPYDPPEPFRSRFLNPKWKRGRRSIYVDGIPKGPFTKQDVRYLVQLYDGGIRATDSALDSFFRTLRKDRLLDATVVVIAADHGESFLDHGHLGHGTALFQELIRVPLILAGPAFPKTVARKPVEMIDLAPTLLSLAGISYDPTTVMGHDLAGFLRNSEPLPKDRILASEVWPAERTTIRQGFKLFSRIATGRLVRAFALKKDPHEIADLLPDGRDDVRKTASAASRLQAREAALRRKLGLAATKAPIDEKTRRDLRKLGYLP